MVGLLPRLRRKDESEKTSRYNWACEVAGTERVSVMAGEFDTWKIVCKRYSGKKVSSKSSIIEIKIWYYAPEIGHYVLTTRQSFSGKPARRLELLAVLPPLDRLSVSARGHMQTSFQRAMEYKKSGESLPWAIPNTGISGEITPTNTFKLEDGRFCRRYVQKKSRQILRRLTFCASDLTGSIWPGSIAG